MTTTRFLAIACAAVFPAAMAFFAQGCSSKSDAHDQVSSAVPPPPPPPVTAAPTTTVAPEDAGVADAAADADASDGHAPIGSGADPTGIKKCCSALRGNMKTAPLDQQAALGIAAGVCDGLVNNPQGRSALAQVRGILRGANMPAACQ